MDESSRNCYVAPMTDAVAAPIAAEPALPLRFQFNERKGVEALTYVARQWPGITAFFASKVLFFAEKMHLNRYARPIVADTFIAMQTGRCPRRYTILLRVSLGRLGTLRLSRRRSHSAADNTPK